VSLAGMMRPQAADRKKYFDEQIYTWIFRFLFDPDQWVALKWLRQFATFAAIRPNFVAAVFSGSPPGYDPFFIEWDRASPFSPEDNMSGHEGANL